MKGVLQGQALALPANIRLGWKGSPGTKHSSLLQKSVNYVRKSFIVQALGANVMILMKLFTAVSYEFL